MTAGLNYNLKEERWDIYHKFEKGQKKYYLERLTAGDGFKILKELHRFAYKSGVKLHFNKLDVAKIETLANVHSIFGRIKV